MSGQEHASGHALRLQWAEIEKTVHASEMRTRNREWGRLREEFFNRIGGYIDPPDDDVRRLSQLKDKYKGKRIFIIGNGPSLNRTPLHLLKDEYTFGVNRIYLLYDRIDWRPTFYTATDWRVVPDIADEINALRGSTFFFEERFRGLLREGDDVYYYTHKNAPPHLQDQQKFSYDASLGVRGAGSVVGTSVQLAFHLGFDPIYLIGCDLGYKVEKTVKQEGEDVFGTGVKLHLTSTRDDDPNHFDPRYFGAGSRWHDPNVERMIRGHIQCRYGVRSKNRHIYNATVGGELDVYERKNFSDLFGPPQKEQPAATGWVETAQMLGKGASELVSEVAGLRAKTSFLLDVMANEEAGSSERAVACFSLLDDLENIFRSLQRDDYAPLRGLFDDALTQRAGLAEWSATLLPHDCSVKPELVDGKFVKRIATPPAGAEKVQLDIVSTELPAGGRYSVSIEYSFDAREVAMFEVIDVASGDVLGSAPLPMGHNRIVSTDIDMATHAKGVRIRATNSSKTESVFFFKAVIKALKKAPPPILNSLSASLRRKRSEKKSPIFQPVTTEPLTLSDVNRLYGLQNKFADERIFIMGNGPSLNKTPLDLLKDDYVFGLNRISLLFERISWRPTFFTAFDVRVVPDNKEEFASLDIPYKFFSARYKPLMGEKPSHYWHHTKGFYEGFEGCFEPTAPYFGFGGGGTIAIIAIELAFFMGFREIYLIGTDVSYSVPNTVTQSGEDVFGNGVKLELESTQDDDHNHFDPRYFGRGKKWHSPNVRDMKIGFSRAASYMERRGGRLLNATIGGELEDIERVDFESLF